MHRLSCLFLFMAVGFGAWCAQEPWITSDSYNNLNVVVAEAATPSEHFAATEFQKYWEATTGQQATLSSTANPTLVNVLIGRDSAPSLKPADLEGLGDDGFLIRTLATGDLVIAGGRQRGTLYGVHEFFKKYLGVRWLTPDVTHIPKAPSAIPAIDYRYVPPFVYRDISYRAFMNNPYYAVAHRLNGSAIGAIPREMGGNIKFVGPGGHSFFSYVPPKEYGEAHPEYFAEVDGERLTDSPKWNAQLCLSNPDVVQITIDKVRKYFRNSPPGFRLVSVTQMDLWGWCTCERCQAIDDREGSPAGSIITFVNKVAEAIEEEFPDGRIHTFAYMYSRKPPRHVKPRDNVIVQLCSIECDFSRPLSDRDSALNRAFQKDIKDWSRITKNLFIYDYSQNWWCFQQPQPNYHVFQPNAKFFADNGVMGVYEQASPLSPHSDFEYLKGYILSESLWDPDVDWRALYDEFVDLYYGPAAPFIRDYHQLITNKVREDNYELTIFSRMEWMDYDTVIKAQALFADAFDAVKGDPEATQRLTFAYIPVQYAALVCPPKIQQTPKAYILTRPPSQTFDEYWDMIRGYGVSFLADELIFELEERMDRKTPPRYERLEIEKLENDLYELWIVPARNGSIVKFEAKESGTDLLTGYKDIENDSGMWQTWSIAVPEVEETFPEHPVAEAYEVIERTDDSLTIQCETEDGLLVTQTLRLPHGAGDLEVTMTLTNTTAAPLTPRVKIHPEFAAPGKAAPELYLKRDGTWEPIKLAWLPELTRLPGSSGLAGGSIKPTGASAWAWRVPKGRLKLVNRFDPDELEHLFYFYRRADQLLNMELVPVQTPLAPGETRTLHSTYSITKERLKKL